MYYDLISAFHRKTSIPVILNTSFNENEPIVCTPEEAIDCFQRTRMDVLAIGPFLVTKPKAENLVSSPERHECRSLCAGEAPAGGAIPRRLRALAWMGDVLFRLSWLRSSAHQKFLRARFLRITRSGKRLDHFRPTFWQRKLDGSNKILPRAWFATAFTR